MLEKNRSSLAGERVTDTVERGANCAGAERPMTIRENINRSIEGHNRDIARLVMLRDTTPAAILDMPQPNLAALVYPDNPFI